MRDMPTMTRDEAIKWIKKLISEMKKETSGNYPDPEYRDEVYKALDMAISDMKRVERLEEMVERLDTELSSKKIVVDWLEGKNKRLKDEIRELYELSTDI